MEKSVNRTGMEAELAQQRREFKIFRRVSALIRVKHLDEATDGEGHAVHLSKEVTQQFDN